jgi:hypothetical protein
MIYVETGKARCARALSILQIQFSKMDGTLLQMHLIDIAWVADFDA